MSERPSAQIRAAGAVLWRDTPEGIRVAVVHRPRYDDWSLPKGKVDAQETVPAAAVRELAEETGFSARLGRRLSTVRYPVRGSMKTVEYFSAAAGPPARTELDGEVDELRWLSVTEAERLVSYEADIGVLRAFSALPAALSSVLLVRHAKAGKRSEWTGDDDLRPLSPAGVRQAEAIRTLAPLFGVDRVFSAPPLRCVQTAHGVATDLGVTVRSEPLLSEREYSRDPARGLARLLAIVTAGGTPLICSQGGVIPGLVGTLASRHGLTLPLGKNGAVPCKKGSVWVLSFQSESSNGTPVLAAADYYPTALPSPRPKRAGTTR